MTCRDPECGSPVKARELCGRHYQSYRRSGELAKLTTVDRFWAQVDKSSGACWVWTGPRNGKYGRLGSDNRHLYAHRYSYELAVGEIPDQMTIDHLCRNTLCVRPDHLEVVTLAENIRRAVRVRPRKPPKTVCPHGHSKELSAGGRWWCRECNRVRSRDRQRVRRGWTSPSFGEAA